MNRSIVIYDGGPQENPAKRFDVHFERFKTQRAAQIETKQADSGKVVGFIPLNLDDDGVRALESIVGLARVWQDMSPEPEKIPVLQLLRDIFLAGRASAMKP